MRRVGLVVALGALLGMLAGAATASPALADGRGDGWQVNPLPPSSTLPAEFCGFEIQMTQLVNKSFGKELKTADGSLAFLITGAQRVSFTNPANGKTITENNSAPFTVIVYPDGSVTTLVKGVGVEALMPAAAARFGLPGLFVAAGSFTVMADPNGNITSLSLNGHVLVDVCAALS